MATVRKKKEGAASAKKLAKKPASKAASSSGKKAGYHHGDLREALLVAARGCLEKSGPSGLSFREVARVAGVSHAAPYHHFPDKETLLAALVQEAYTGLSTAMQAAVSDLDDTADTFQRLVALGRGYVRFACKEPEAFHLMWRRDLVDSSKFADLVEAAGVSYEDLSVKVADVHGATGATPNPPSLDNLLMWSITHGIALLFLSGSLQLDAPEFDNLVHSMLERSMGIFVAGDDVRIPHDAIPPPDTSNFK